MKTKGSRNKKGVSRILNRWGYYEVFEPAHPLAKKNGYIREHRMITYNAGILKNKTDEVHHINGIKTDNRLENLEVMPKAKHTSITWKGQKRKPWTDEMRKAKSEQMKGNKNYRGTIYESPELLTKQD